MINEVKKILNESNDSVIIMDFDYTLTDYSSYSSIGVFKNYLSEEYIKAKKVIDNKIDSLLSENNTNITELWSKKIQLLNKHADLNLVNRIINDDNLILREKLISILKLSYKNNVPVYIISSGCKEIIEQVLIKNNINFKNIHIIANSFLKPSCKTITPYNKKEFFHEKNQTYLLFGDQKDDFFIKENAYYFEFFNDDNFRTISSCNNKKCTYGLCLYKDKISFYKINIKFFKNRKKTFLIISKNVKFNFLS